MKVKKAYEFRIYPSKADECLIKRTFGCSRFVYNKMLESIKTEKKRPTEVELKTLYPFLKEVDSIALQQSRINLQTAFKNFKEKRTGYPQFKSRFSKQSFRTNCTNKNIKVDFDKSEITLPKFPKPLKFRDQREFLGVIKNVTVKKSSTGKYFAVILVEEEIETIPTKGTKTIGLDMACSHFLTDSEGNNITAPKFFRNGQEKLKKVQRELSKKEKGSENREKQRIKVAKVHEKIKNNRKDFLQKLSTQITNDWDRIVVESLNMKAMSQSLNLAKSIMDNAWSSFDKMLEYKSLWKGKDFQRAEKFFPSSKLCRHCDFKHKDLKLSDLVWTCPNCRRSHDRNINAAINLKNTLGIREIYACGDDVRLKPRTCGASLSSMMQEAPSFRTG